MGGAANVVYTTVMVLPPDKLRVLITGALKKCYPNIGEMDFSIEPTTDPVHGDFTTTVAMKLAPALHQSGKDIAANILANLGTVPMLEKAAVAGPGFINFTLKPAWIMQYVGKILADKKFGQNTNGGDRKVILEYVSANPTGPVTLANGRAAFSGDALANVLRANGWRVTREYYINDFGNQVNILAESVLRRYWQDHGIPTEYPDYCYQGDYIQDLARKLKLDKMKLTDMKTVRDKIKRRILESMIKDHERVMKKSGVRYDSWFRESKIHEQGIDHKVLAILRDHGLLYEKDEATWFKTTVFGDDQDRVVVKKDGTLTYLVADVALRWNRFARRAFERELIFLGADHHGYVKRLEAAAAALGFAHRVEVIILQFVRLIRDGQEVKMSKRAGNFVTLEELIDEVGTDVARFFFLMHSPNTHMDFDLGAAKEKSEKNPVFYVQYAHARMQSILKKVGRTVPVKSKEPPHRSEVELTKTLLQFPQVVSEVAASFETQKLPFYAIELATKFHEFYDHCRVIDEGKVWSQRLGLVKATVAVLKKTLALMGVSAPDKM